jgi:hypothetical protein
MPVKLPVLDQDPLGLQMRNLCSVVRGAAEPVVSGREGWRPSASSKRSSRPQRQAVLSK